MLFRINGHIDSGSFLKLSIQRSYKEGPVAYRGGKKGRIERLKKRLETPKKEELCDLAFKLNGEILCNACALKRGVDFIFSNSWFKVSLDDLCFSCEKSIREASAGDSHWEIFYVCMLRDLVESEM